MGEQTADDIHPFPSLFHGREILVGIETIIILIIFQGGVRVIIAGAINSGVCYCSIAIESILICIG